jgi:rhamnogalacturonyl hydrolase YesR
MGLVFGYDKFGDQKYLDAANKVVARLLEKEQSLGRLPGTQPVWQGQMLEALIKYYETTKDVRVQDAVVRHVKWLKDTAIQFDDATGKFKLLYQIQNSGLPTQSYIWTNESNYIFLLLNSFSYTYAVTGDDSYIKLANQMYDQAVADQMPFNGARYISSYLGFPYYYLEHRVID